MLAMHLALLALPVLMTIGFVARAPGYPSRSLGKLLFAAMPFLLIGLGCILLMSGPGVPLLEWVLPTIGILVVGLFCKSNRLFAWMHWTTLPVAVILCVNFMVLVSDGFTANPRFTMGSATAVQQVKLAGVRKYLLKRYAPGTELPEGPVADLTDGVDPGPVAVVSVRKRWYTPVTRLYRLDRQDAEVWYPGGEVVAASQKLEIRPKSGPSPRRSAPPA